MRKRKMIIVMLIMTVMVFSFAFSAYALDTYKGDFHIKGSASYTSSIVKGEMSVKNEYGLSAVLSCSTYGNAYNGVNAVVGTYSASVTKYNVQSVSCNGSGTCYMPPSYGRAWYTFQGSTWAETF